MTLIELLVAMTALTVVIGATVALLTTSLNMWNDGETSRDAHERAQMIVNQYAADLKHIVVEESLKYSNVPAMLLCDRDQNNAPRLRFVRSGNPGNTGVDRPAQGMVQAVQTPPSLYSELYETVYALDGDGSKPGLWRGIRYFTRDRNTLFRDAELQQMIRSGAGLNLQSVDASVLYAEYKFWTKYSNTWDVSFPPVTSPAAADVRGHVGLAIGPSLVWDSSRQIVKEFFLFRKTFDPAFPNFVFPSALQVGVTIEETSLRPSLVADIGEDEEKEIVLDKGSELPDAPAFFKVEKEWIEYREKNGDRLGKLQRGARGTFRSPHKANTPARYGTDFAFEISLPVYLHQEE